MSVISGPSYIYPSSVYKAVEKHPNFLSFSPVDGVLEIYVDNHVLNSLRMCEGYFVESILNRIQGRGRSWNLTFGQWFHKMMEYFYQGHKEDWKGVWETAFEHGNYRLSQDIINFIMLAEFEWKALEMDEFASFKQYKALDGFKGASLLLLQYFNLHTQGNERLRVVGSELSFGRNREIPLVAVANPGAPYRAYLTGRIDIVIDTGDHIGPLDHKTTAYFDGTEGQGFKPHDGMCGYAYALNTLIEPELKKQGRKCNTVIINHICLKDQKDPALRFKRSFKSYTDAEFDEYVSRQQRTIAKLYDIVCLNAKPDWNTMLCTMMYYHDCPYKSIHEVSPASRDTVINQFYQIGPAWNPYDIK